MPVGARRKHENLKQAQTRCNRTLQLATSPGGLGNLALLFYEGLPQDPPRSLILNNPIERGKEGPVPYVTQLRRLGPRESRKLPQDPTAGRREGEVDQITLTAPSVCTKLFTSSISRTSPHDPLRNVLLLPPFHRANGKKDSVTCPRSHG